MRRATIALFALVASCGGSEPSEATPSADAIVADTTSTPADTATAETAIVDSTTPPDVTNDADIFGPYPAGPYGNKVGDIVANLAWEGYVSPLADALANTKPYVTTSMDQLRRDAKKGYALIHVSEFY